MAITISLFAMGVTASQALASDVNLGDPTTIDELLASPEYRPEHSDIARLYQAFFDRTPDVAGLLYWIEVWEDGTDMNDLSAIFATSVEFQATYGGDLSNGQFLEIVYRNVLGRDYDQAGFDYWLSQMNGGLSRAATVLFVGLSDEFKGKYPYSGTAPDISQALLGSNDLGGSWTNFDSGRFEDTPAELAALSACRQLTLMPSNAYWSGADYGDTYRWFQEEIYSFSDEADAIAVINRVASVESTCPSYTVTYDDGLTVQRSTWGTDRYTADGDDYVEINQYWDFSDGGRLGLDVVAVRVGTTVAILWHIDSPEVPYDYLTAELVSLVVDRIHAVHAGA